MKHSDFEIGGTFWCSGRQWRCTDIGTRTIIAICLDDTEIVISSLDPAIQKETRTLTRSEAEAEGWYNGPPYTVAEEVLDEYTFHACAFNSEGNGETSYDAGECAGGPFPGARKVLLARRDAARALKAASAANNLPSVQA